MEDFGVKAHKIISEELLRCIYESVGWPVVSNLI